MRHTIQCIIYLYFFFFFFENTLQKLLFAGKLAFTYGHITIRYLLGITLHAADFA